MRAEGLGRVGVEVGEMAGDGAAEVGEDLGDLFAEVDGGLVDGVAMGLGVGGGVAAGGGQLGVYGGDGVAESGVESIEARRGGGFEAREMRRQRVREGEQARVLLRD